MSRCHRCKIDLQPHVMSEHIGKDLYCIPCANDLWAAVDQSEYKMACANCYALDHLQLFPQRVVSNVVGLLVLCVKCAHLARGKSCIISVSCDEQSAPTGEDS